MRILYDDLGCFLILPIDFVKQTETAGIECAIFNPFRPLLTVKQNNRDHHKIVVIDGKIDFTGGINLAGPIGMLLGVPAASEGSHCKT